MKILRAFLIAAVAALAVVAVTHIPFADECRAIREGTLRLHVRANSDSQADQSAKLFVRDAVLAATREAFEGVSTKRQALAAAGESLLVAEGAARQALASLGIDAEVRAYLARGFFATLEYGDVTLPAGMYDAVRIDIGAAQGKNWWCVMYPALCVPPASATREQTLCEAYSDDCVEVVLGGERYAVRFKLEELIQRLLVLLRKD